MAKWYLSSTVLFAVLTVSMLVSCSRPQTISTELSNRMKAGRFIEKIWKDPTLLNTNDLMINSEWKSESPNSDLVKYFASNTQKLSKNSSNLRLNIKLFHYRSFAPPFLSPSLTIEGSISAKDGKILSVFSHSVNLGFPGLAPAKAGLDRAWDEICKEYGLTIANGS